jgi:hypothetical protein
MQLARTIYNPIVRVTLMMLFCFGVSACSIATKTTNLKDVSSDRDETRLLKPVGYVFHDEVYANPNKKHTESVNKFIESEKQSWIDALSSFTNKDNIFTMSSGKPTSKNNSYPEFAKTHAIVDVFVKPIPEEEGLTMDDVIYGSPVWLAFLSFGTIPIYLPIPYIASFTLTLPEEKHTAPTHWDYTYEREEYYWFPLLIPMEEYLDSIDDTEDVNARWKAEEKRRLVLRFLQDAKPMLQEQ